MATFITQIKFTPAGLAAIKDTTRRAAAFKTAAKKMGVKVTGIYWTLGEFDGLLVCEADDASSVTAALLKLSGAGNVQTSTVRAFNAAEMDEILAK